LQSCGANQILDFVSGAGTSNPAVGTITGVTAGTDLTGGGSSGNVTLNVDTTTVVTGVTAASMSFGGGSLSALVTKRIRENEWPVRLS
jgi:hypothetical protein